MKITIKLFARMRDLVGANHLERDVPPQTTVAGLLENLQAEYPRLAETVSRTIISVNKEFADKNTVLTDGDEVAFFPPVSGGSGIDDKFEVTFNPVSLDAWAAKVVKPETGAVAVFGGTVRNVSVGKAVQHLEYEAYHDMAIDKLQQIAVECRQKWPKITDIAIVQRIGHLDVGENAVIVAVSSPHRKDGCFEACAYAIDRLKQIVPIWKKEVGPNGNEWIEGDYLPTRGE
jgi:molybdopterin converting factor subunit 1